MFPPIKIELHARYHLNLDKQLYVELDYCGYKASLNYAEQEYYVQWSEVLAHQFLDVTAIP